MTARVRAEDVIIYFANDVDFEDAVLLGAIFVRLHHFKLQRQ